MKLIRNATIHDAVHDEARVGDILIDGSQIAAIGQGLAAPEGAELIDASGLNAWPGLVEAHGHIGLDGWAVGYEGRDYNEYNDPVTPQLRAIDAINPFDESLRDAVRGGVTTLCTGPGSSNQRPGRHLRGLQAGGPLHRRHVPEAGGRHEVRLW